ncbi:hypothetical protein CTI14_13710 [Methylobacterium radiotolerans]|nr:hypothetical protein CTI14_13710 [Methylobacterium radiotolerans]
MDARVQRSARYLSGRAAQQDIALWGDNLYGRPVTSALGQERTQAMKFPLSGAENKTHIDGRHSTIPATSESVRLSA